MHTKAQNLNNIILIFENFLGAKTRVLHSGAGALYTAFKSSSHLQFIAFFSSISIRREISNFIEQSV